MRNTDANLKSVSNSCISWENQSLHHKTTASLSYCPSDFPSQFAQEDDFANFGSEESIFSGIPPGEQNLAYDSVDFADLADQTLSGPDHDHGGVAVPVPYGEINYTKELSPLIFPEKNTSLPQA